MTSRKLDACEDTMILEVIDTKKLKAFGFSFSISEIAKLFKVVRMRTMIPNELYKIELKEEESGGRNFKLEKAVCNHGFFMMAPNYWNPTTKELLRPLRLSNSTTSLTVSIFQPPNLNSLRVRLLPPTPLSLPDLQIIQEKIKRMLRISAKDEMSLQDFFGMHEEARKKGFGRMFRSPTLFEDALKSLLLINCTLSRALNMANALCDLQEKLASGFNFDCKKRKRVRKNFAALQTNEPPKGNFPTAQELASLDIRVLKNYYSFGYRADYIHKFAEIVASGKLGRFEDIGELRTTEEIYKSFLQMQGFGHFACANVLMSLGFYHKVPDDTETIRILQKVYEKKVSKKDIGQVLEQLYGNYAPFQCLAYWFDVIGYYESKVGSLVDLPRSRYATVAASYLQKAARTP